MQNNSLDARLCECGCNRSLKGRSGKTRFYDATCRKRVNRAERGETPPAVTMCACGCGNPAIGRRKLYASDACKQRMYRRRKEFDELGPDFDWSERPEATPKRYQNGYKIRLNNW